MTIFDHKIVRKKPGLFLLSKVIYHLKELPKKDLLLFKMFIFVKRHFTIFFEAQHSTRTKVWVKNMDERK
jgi:hypothetical protein